MNDYLELAAYILGCDANYVDVEDVLYERWEITYDVFEELVGEILPLTPTLQSPLTERPMHVLGVVEEDGVFCALARIPAG